MSYSKDALSKYRLSRSRESIEEAKLLSKANHWNTVANRLYYACFYMASAYLVKIEIEGSTHASIKTGFNLKLIKTGKLEKKYGNVYNKLFNLRQDADYRDYRDVSETQISPMIIEVERMLREIESLLE